MKFCTKRERNRAICGGVTAISVFDLMTLNIVLRVALRSGIIFTKFDLRQLICAWILAFLMRYVTSLFDHDLWPLDLELLQHFGCHAFKLSTKFERNRVIHYWVINDLASFRCVILGGGESGAQLTVLSQRCVDWTSPNLARIYGDHRSIALLLRSSDILLHFQTWAAQSWVMLKTTPNFSL